LFRYSRCCSWRPVKDLPARLVFLVTPVSQAILVTPVHRDLRDLRDLQEPPVFLATPATPVSPVFPVNLV
jgi:hypothetical protein